MIYNYPAVNQANLPARLNVGAIPSASDIQAINRAATVLSNLRWSATVAFPPGGTFSSGTIDFYLPFASSGRWGGQHIIQSPNSLTVTGVRLRNMLDTSTATSWTSTFTSITDPTDLRGTAGGTWRVSTMVYPTSTTYALLTNGCSRLRCYGVNGSTPIGVGITCYARSGGAISAGGHFAGWRYDGELTPGWPDLSIQSLSAAWARAIENELEVAEAMPVIIGILPEVSGATGLPAYDAALLRRVMTKQIPLARPRRPKALFFAVHSTTTGNPIVRFQVGGQQINQWSTVYTSGAYRVLKARLNDEAYSAAGEAGGVPIVNVEMTSFDLTPRGATAWIGEDF